jgi:hypothetical protein
MLHSRGSRERPNVSKTGIVIAIVFVVLFIAIMTWLVFSGK